MEKPPARRPAYLVWTLPVWLAVASLIYRIPVLSFSGSLLWRTQRIRYSPVHARHRLRTQDPVAKLESALAGVQASWMNLKRRSAEEKPGLDEFARFKLQRQRSVEAAELLAMSANVRLEQFRVSTGSLVLPPKLTGDDALRALIGLEGLHLVVTFLSPAEKVPNRLVDRFIQAQLHTDSGTIDRDDLLHSFETGKIEGRQSFLLTAQFGYFLRRSLKRLRLENSLREDPEPVSLQDYMTFLPEEQVPPLMRFASEETASAVKLKTTELFGPEAAASEEADDGKVQLEQLPAKDPEPVALSMAESRRLNVEAAAFGAALCDAEDVAERYQVLSPRA
eukprot:TRINITY_DN106168_c0_g1_i1.p1 TRINITY_DN106168_c0_g1~~TRINITY_DN106168_c0_g1_i1.p1  ORF type:complete len:336 (+),score=71.54 TRINITY_DN106168_c0_g1_i1:29-1036(+)